MEPEGWPTPFHGGMAAFGAPQLPAPPLTGSYDAGELQEVACRALRVLLGSAQLLAHSSLRLAVLGSRAEHHSSRRCAPASTRRGAVQKLPSQPPPAAALPPTAAHAPPSSAAASAC